MWVMPMRDWYVCREIDKFSPFRMFLNGDFYCQIFLLLNRFLNRYNDTEGFSCVFFFFFGKLFEKNVKQTLIKGVML